jgi:SET domain-containing protein
MIHVKYKLDKSGLHGIGFFANQDIPKGTLIYSASPLLDLNLSQEKFNLLSDSEKDEIRYWGFWVEAEKVWHVDFDNSKFLNHSKKGNVTQDFSHPEAWLIAANDIKSGEEMTQNYLEFESEEDLKRRGIEL